MLCSATLGFEGVVFGDLGALGCCVRRPWGLRGSTGRCLAACSDEFPEVRMLGAEICQGSTHRCASASSVHVSVCGIGKPAQLRGAGRHGAPAPHTLLGCYVNDDAAWVVEGKDVERFDTVNADDELGSAFKR